MVLAPGTGRAIDSLGSTEAVTTPGYGVLMGTDTPAETVCARCRRALIAIDEIGGNATKRSWHHTGPTTSSGGMHDHAVEPISLDAVGREQVSVCDFCHAGAPGWRFPCDNFTLPAAAGIPVGQVSIGDWAACRECRQLIEAGDRSGLLDRCLAKYQGAPERVRHSLRANLQRVFRQFYQHRHGPAGPL